MVDKILLNSRVPRIGLFVPPSILEKFYNFGLFWLDPKIMEIKRKISLNEATLCRIWILNMKNQKTRGLFFRLMDNFLLFLKISEKTFSNDTNVWAHFVWSDFLKSIISFMNLLLEKHLKNVRLLSKVSKLQYFFFIYQELFENLFNFSLYDFYVKIENLNL